MAIPNYGLISGLADGLHQGLLDYQVISNAKRNQKRDDFINGLQQDDQGNYQYTPQKQQAIDSMNQLNQYKMKSEMAEYDPNSEAAQGYRGLISQKLGYQPPENTSLHDLKNYVQPIEVANKTDELKNAAQERNQSRVAMEKDKLDKKTSDEQDKYYQTLRKDSETFRGNQAAQTAAQGVLAGRRALDVLKQVKDPNDLNPQQIANFTAELSKIASGGTATEGAMNHMLPNGSGMTFASLIQKISNQPTAAKQGAMILQNKKYLEDMMDTSQDSLDQHRAMISRGVWRKLSPEQQDEYLQDYPGAAKYLRPAQQNSSQPSSGLLNAVAPPVQNQSSAHPQDSAAVQWAKAHPDDARSKDILKLNGL